VEDVEHVAWMMKLIENATQMFGVKERRKGRVENRVRGM